MEEWAFSSYRKYLELEGQEWVDSVFREYPIVDFIDQWDLKATG